MTGCRDSDVLTEKIIGEPLQYTVDYSLTPQALNNPNASSTSSQDLGESERKDIESEENTPKYDDEDQTTDEQANGTESADYSQNTEAAQSGKSTGNKSGAAAYDGSTSEKKKGASAKFDFTQNDKNKSSNEGNTDETDPDKNADDNWNPEDSNSKDGTNNNSNPTVIGSDEIDGGNIPSTIARVAANGIVATLVQAIGGTTDKSQNPLVAANEGWLSHLSASQYDQVFPGEKDGIIAISGWGEGESTQWNDSVINAILAAFGEFEAGTVAVIAGYGQITSNAATTLQEKGVSVLELKPMGRVDALDADMKTNVNAIGQILRGAADGGALAAQRVQQWNSLHTEALEKTLSNNGGYTCLSKEGSTFNYAYEGKGVGTEIANVSSTRNFALYFDRWAIAKRNIAAQNAMGTYSGSYGYRGRDANNIWPRSNSKGGWNGATAEALKTDISTGTGVWLKGHQSVNENESQHSGKLILSRYLQYAGAADVTLGLYYIDSSSPTDGDHFSYTARSRFLNEYCSWEHDICFMRGTDSSAGYVCLGDSDYPYILVRDSSMASPITTSAAIARPQALEVGFYNVGQNYGVAVVPCGVTGSWADGTFESFLLAPYLYCLYHNRDASSYHVNASYADNYVNNFYSQMYRCGSQGILDAGANNGSGGTGGYGEIYVAQCNRA